MGAFDAMPNIGPKLEAQLFEVGIETPEQLRETGAEQAWLRILARDPSACVHRMYALAGAVRGVRKAELPEAEKKRLCALVREAKGSKR